MGRSVSGNNPPRKVAHPTSSLSRNAGNVSGVSNTPGPPRKTVSNPGAVRPAKQATNPQATPGMVPQDRDAGSQDLGRGGSVKARLRSAYNRYSK